MKINDITMEQLRDIYNGKIKSWKELGGPDRPISVVSRDTSSGTYEVWEEKILKGDKVRPMPSLLHPMVRLFRLLHRINLPSVISGSGILINLSKSLR